MNRETLQKITTALFFMGVTIELALVLLDKMRLSPASQGLLFRVTFVLFLGAMLGKRYSRGEWLWFLAFCGIGFLSWRITQRNEILRMAVFVMSMKGQPLRKAMRYAFWFTAAGCGIIFSLAALGIYGDRVLAADTSGRGLEVRYTMGFGHPNALHCMACMLILFGLYLYGRRMKLYGYAVLFVSNLVLYALTRSESGMLTATLGIALFLLFRQAPSLPEREATYRIGEAAFAAGLLFSFWAACVKPEAPLLQRLDSVVLTGRVASLWDTVYHQGTLSTWALFSPPSNNYYFDMGWVRLVYWYGVIPAAAVLAVVFGLYRVCRLRRDGAAFLLLLTCCLYTVLEAHLVSVFLLRNMLFFLVGLYAEELFGTGEGRKEQTE